MSRCFPFPPPGYAGKSASNDALILTIKLQRESEKVKSDKKKDRKREKKDKKREDKPNGILYGDKKILTGDEKLYQSSKYVKYPADCGQIKQQEASCELIEKSSLTEEHGKPCGSSDSTENSGNGKRKRQSPPQAINNTRTPGTVFRTVLNSRKKEEAPTTTSTKNVSLTLKTASVNSLSQKADAGVKSSTSIRPVLPLLSNATQQLTLKTASVNSLSQKADAGVKSSNSIRPVPPLLSNATQQLIVTCSKKEKHSSPVKAIDEASTSKEAKKLPRPLRKYMALFENWVPLSMEIETVNDDEDWLLGSKPEKRVKCCKEEVPFYGVEPTFQPRPHFLADADIYALPFTVPF